MEDRLPRIRLVDKYGDIIAQDDWLSRASRALNQGHILAVKGIGGFHLTCDARNREAVSELRRRKRRPAKPFAIMCRDIVTVKSLCHIAPEEMEYLVSPPAPIVLLRTREGHALPKEIAPGMGTLGIMMPYTQLHRLLLENGPPIQVMTSGNVNGMPLVKDNQEALDVLGHVADYFLLHDDHIGFRCDDSLLSVVNGKGLFIRRSRGYHHHAIEVPVDPGSPVTLGVGGDMKNTFSLIVEGRAHLSQHIGSLEYVEGQRVMEEGILHLCDTLGVRPMIVTSDLHPGYNSYRIADGLAERFGALRHRGVQHHHAHMASCMAENGVDGDAIGIILDGTGYGPDGRMRGFEIMTGGYHGFTRGYHLAYVPLPGGDGAIRRPWVTAVAYLITFLGQEGRKIAFRLFPGRGYELELVDRILSQGINAPLASSCGRIFDAVSALLGLCLENTYEGQAAVTLGDLMPWSASREALDPYPFDFNGPIIDPTGMLVAICDDIDRGTGLSIITKRFHHTIIRMVVDAAERVRESKGLSNAVLSGGTWQNPYLYLTTGHILKERGFKVLTHGLLPPGDGSLALGQAVVALKDI